MTDIGMKFIGVPLGSDAEVLLGLNTQSGLRPLSAPIILDALQSGLSRVAAHPQRATRDADVVREALHEAARQLLDRTLDARIPEEVVDSARRIVEENGEISEDVVRRINAVATSQGIDPDALLTEVLHGARQSRSDFREESSRSPEPMWDTQAHEISPRRSVDPRVRWIVAAVGCILAAIAIVTIVLTITKSPQSNDARIVPELRKSETGETRGPIVEDSVTVPGATQMPNSEHRILEWSDHLQRLTDCSEMHATDPAGAMELFATTFETMSSVWPDSTRPELIAAGNGILDFIYALETPEEIAGIAIVLDPSRQISAERFPDPVSIRSVCFTTAISVRVLREANVPPVLRSKLRESLESLYGERLQVREQTFDGGMRAALNAIPGVVISAMKLDPTVEASTAAWAAWNEAVEAIEGADSQAFDRTVSFALESLMLELPDPDRDERTRSAIAVLTGALKWRKDSSSRVALLRWLENRSVSSADLQALTSSLATKSGAEGVDPTMVLPANADAAVRTELRARYAEVWGILESGRSLTGELATWGRLARELAAEPMPETQVWGFLRALRMARLSALGEALRDGSVSRVPDGIEADDPQIVTLITRHQEQPELKVIHGSGERDWSFRYLVESKAGTVSARIAMLGGFIETMNPLNADIIVQEAFRGAPEEVRQHARRIVSAHNSDPVLINAVLRIQPKIIPSVENLQLLEIVTGTPLPSVKSPSWRFECRRALVATLVQAFAKESPSGVIDVIAESLAQTYGRQVEPGRTEVVESQSDPLVAVSELRSRLYSEASRAVPTGREHSSLYGLVNSRKVRIQSAAGVIQQFHAEQLSCIDLLAYLVVAEDPSKAAEVRDVIRRFEQVRREATHILQQVREGERVRLELWILRIGAPPATIPDSEAAP